mgnify:CR=1 FL=1
MDDINVGLQNSATVIRNVPIANGSEQDAWYAITACDQFNNCNLEILEGMTSNSRLIREDSRAPTVDMELVDEDGIPYTSPSLVPGLYTVKTPKPGARPRPASLELAPVLLATQSVNRPDWLPPEQRWGPDGGNA